MPQRSVVEEARYRRDLEQLVPDARQLDDLRSATATFLAHDPEAGDRLEHTRVWTKTIMWDLPTGRYLVIFYTIDENAVRLQALKEFSAF